MIPGKRHCAPISELDTQLSPEQGALPLERGKQTVFEPHDDPAGTAEFDLSSAQLAAFIDRMRALSEFEAKLARLIEEIPRSPGDDQALAQVRPGAGMASAHGLAASRASGSAKIADCW